MKNWLIIGIGGATCSGKTTLAKRLDENLKDSILLNQDTYFLPEDDPRHTQIPQLNHHNWDILESLDMEKMYSDISKVLSDEKTLNDLSYGEKKAEHKIDRRILILDGFLLFNYKPIAKICDLKYFLDLSKEECERRRKKRIYDPPDVPGYFELVVWPEYIAYKSKIENDEALFDQITFLDGKKSNDEVFQTVFAEITKNCDKISTEHQELQE